MKPHQCQAAILEHLQEQRKYLIEELTHYFDTAGATTREDLVILESAGTVIRTYDGVTSDKGEFNPSISHKVLIDTHEKEQIAETTTRFTHDGGSIILDAGSTVLQVMSMLTCSNNTTTVISSLYIVNALSELDSEQTILMPGGIFHKKSVSLHDRLAENVFGQFSFDKLFMDANGIDLNAGVTTFNEVFSVNKTIYNATREVISMVDLLKFGHKNPNVTRSLENVGKLITNAGADPAPRQALEAKGIKVIIAGETNE